MKIPLSWLKEYVDLQVSVKELAERLTFSGIEIEGIHSVGSNFPGVVVGEVLDVQKHPGADRLVLCRVHDGQSERRVVCGARNFKVGDKAPFVPAGSKLPNGMEIKSAKIRGELSEGMLCAEDELGISEDHSGIMILPAECRPGTPLVEVLGGEETVLELEITWNRPDCLSVIGVAREVAALFGCSLKLPPVDFVEAGDPIERWVGVRIEDAVGCPRYTARVLSDVKLGPSPLWMQRRLTLSGVRPINNIVDVTNYVMLECGEPLHAFDYTLLRGRQIVVRRARDGESMATLDGVQRPITPAMLVIADAERPVALAGIMGGAGSEIRDETRTVLLESAVFAPPLIRRTTSTLGLSTESSHRYERGVDVGAADWCSRRAARLMAELAGATIARGVRDEFPAGLPDRRVACRFARTRDLLGYPVSDDRVVSILESLALPVVSRTAEACVVQVPSFRPDLELEADLIEEVARMNGLDKVPEVIPQCRIIPGATDKATQATMRCRERLVGLGLSEIMNYSFLSRQLLDVVGAEDGRRRVELPNPVSQDYAVMRPSLLPQMVESLGRNMARQVPEAAFFELGRVFLRSEDGGIREEERLSLGLMGRVGRLGVGVLAPLQDDEAFLCMKGVVEAFLYAQHVCDYRVERTDVPCFKSGRSVIFSRDGQRIGVMGLLSDAVRRNWRMGEPVAVGEFLLSAVLNDTARVGGGLQPLPAFPAVARDVAMVVAETITHEEIVKTIRKSAPKELTQIVLFDIFRSEGIGSGRKSMAYSLVYRSAERTLTDEEANGFHETVKAALRSELKAEVRES